MQLPASNPFVGSSNSDVHAYAADGNALTHTTDRIALARTANSKPYACAAHSHLNAGATDRDAITGAADCQPNTSIYTRKVR